MLAAEAVLTGQLWKEEQMTERKPVPEPADAIKDLRAKVLSTSPAELGLSPSPEAPNVWGMLMEIGYPVVLVSLVVLADGTTSLYLGHGGRVIGGGRYASVRSASARFLSAAECCREKLQPTRTFPYPHVGQVKFYVLTLSGILFADADEEELAQKSHWLADLFYAGQNVLTQLRLIDEGGTEDDNTTWAGESGYLNCLLTVLAEETSKTAVLSSQSPVPPLLPLAQGDEWLSAQVRRLRFDYEKLDPKKVCGLLMKSAGLSRLNPFRRKGCINTLLAPSDPRAESVPTSFVVEKTRGSEGELALRVTQGEA